MRQFDFFGTADDWAMLLTAIEACGDLVFIPDIWYEHPQPLFLKKADESLKMHLIQRPRVFLWSESFAAFSPALVRAERGARRGQFQLIPGPGVPVITLFLPHGLEVDGILNLYAGDLTAPRTVFDPVAQTETPAEALNAAFDCIRARMKQILKRHMITRWNWIGPDALRLLGQQRVRIAAKGV
jgi:hypothetical protein